GRRQSWIGRDHSIPRGKRRSFGCEGRDGTHSNHLGRRRVPGIRRRGTQTQYGRFAAEVNGGDQMNDSSVTTKTQRHKEILCVFVSLWCLTGVTVFAASPPQNRSFLNQYCVTCHNEKSKIAGLMLDKMDTEHVGEQAETWEKVVRKLRTGMMPPSGARRPERAAIDAF